MTRFFLHIYDYFHVHRLQLWGGLAVVVAALVALILRLDYREDINDFMPFDEDYRRAMQVYQEVAAGDRIVLLFSKADTAKADPEYITQGVERYGAALAELDTAQWVLPSWQPQIDYSQVLDVFTFVYEHLPLFLTEEDYARLDSLMETDPDLVQHRLTTCREQLTSSYGSFVQPMFQNDPLGLGNRIALVLRQYQPQLQFLHIDDYIFTPDSLRCLVTLTSPFGSSETSGNARLCALLDSAALRVQGQSGSENLKVTPIGSPVIAVENASQIRHDSTIAIVIAAVLILALLLWQFRSLKALLQIALATGFGFLFALGCISLVHDSISVIVIGIASIIIGIAVNYPLHFLCHLQHEPRPRVALQELVSPLFIGNVTTVGAFLTLVPLDAVAIRDLGLFAALMLVGTILFVMVVMPHLDSTDSTDSPDSPDSPPALPHREGAVTFGSRNLNWLWTRRTFCSLPMREGGGRVCFFLLLTLLLAYFSLHTRFDTDLQHINYMTSEQRSGMAYLQQLQGQSQGSTVFASVSAESPEDAQEAMEQMKAQVRMQQLDTLLLGSRNPVDLLPSLSLQQQRIGRWHQFWQDHGYGDGLTSSFVKEAEALDFTPEAFDPFVSLLTDSIPLLQYSDFAPLTSTLLTGMSRPGQLVAQYTMSAEAVPLFEQRLTAAQPQVKGVETHVFDLASLTSRVSDALSSNFNYIGYACSAIVFFFLWFSFRRIELALLAFLPMAVGWLWILGIMDLLDIQFNIVNVILASFIFGQGDDYTIFVTEGLVRDYREHRGTLVSYQRSILLSAAIMLVGIGALIVARHPAMHSLAMVTIIGMTVTVAMAWFLPPYVFRWLMKHDKSLREYILK